MNDKILEELSKEGVKSTMTGYKYLVKCIALIVEDWERACSIWAIYEQIAIEYNATPKSVDKAIRYVLKSSGICQYSPSEFICRLADKVRFSK